MERINHALLTGKRQYSHIKILHSSFAPWQVPTPAKPLNRRILEKEKKQLHTYQSAIKVILLIILQRPAENGCKIIKVRADCYR